MTLTQILWKSLNATRDLPRSLTLINNIRIYWSLGLMRCNWKMQLLPPPRLLSTKQTPPNGLKTKMYSGHKLSIFESFSKTNSDHLWFYWELTKVKLNHMHLGKSFCIQTHHHIVVHMSRSECDDEPSVHWKLNWSGGWDEYSHCTFGPTKSLFCRKTTLNGTKRVEMNLKYVTEI